jgi:hypothetical protein
MSPWLALVLALVGRWDCGLRDRGACLDVAAVAVVAGEDPRLVAETVAQESSGRRGVVRFCVHWEPMQDGRVTCPPTPGHQETCRSGCASDPDVWLNRLDVGIWQLHDVPRRVPAGTTNGSSELRRFRTSTGIPVGDKCPLDRVCSAVLASWVILDYKRRAPPPTKDCPDVTGGEGRWLVLWNRCPAYLERTRAAGLR